MLNLQNRQKGIAAILITILVLGVFFGVAISMSVLAVNQNKITRNIVKSSQAVFAAEAGVEDSVYRIIKGRKYEATNNLLINQNRADIQISEEGGNKVIESTGTADQRIRKIKARVAVATTNITFHYGSQVDQGGLQIQPNAKVIGNVYSNGSIQGAGASSIITGDAWVAGGVAPEPDQQWTVKNSDFAFGLKLDKEYILDTAQSFVSSQFNVLSKVSFYLKKQGSPPNQTVRLLQDSGGAPSKTVLASGTLKSSKVTADYSWVEVSLEPAPFLTAGTAYWIMIDVDQDNNNYWVWGEDNTDNYALGTGKYTKDWSGSNVVWKNAGGDLNFKTWLGGAAAFIDNVWVGVDAHARTISNSQIGRDAYYQNIENTTVVGTKYPNSPDPSTKDLPISYAQIQEWENAAEAGGVITPVGGTYTPAAGSSLGPLKINGNLTFPSNSLDQPIIIAGPVWVTGKIVAQNNSGIKLSPDLTAGYTLIADNPADQINGGKIELNNNVVLQDSPAGGYLLIVSTNKSLDSANPAIWLYNNVNKDKAQSIIFTLAGLIKVENNAKFKEVTGYAIYLANNAEIVYETGLINVNFSSGPGASYQVQNWQEIP